MTTKYSQIITVEAVLSYYEFLATIPAIPDSAILTPPPDGWPHITPESVSLSGEHATVLELLRKLPYIKNAEGGNENVSYDTVAVNYSSIKEHPHAKLNWTDIPASAGVLPAHCVVLTIGARYGSYLILDTHQGTITDYVMMERPERQFPPPGHPDRWRAYRTLPVAELFSEWKQNFRSLKWVALGHRGDDGILLNHDRSTEEVREIYRGHGYPDSYRRQECQKALVEWDRRNEALLLDSDF